MSTTDDDAFTAAMRSLAAPRREWGDETVISLAVTYSDEEGRYTMTIINAESMYWDPPQECSITDPEEEMDTVLNLVSDAFEDWREHRAGISSVTNHPQWERKLKSS